MNTTEMIEKATERLQELLIPIILHDYPEFTREQLEKAFDKFGGSLPSWHYAMKHFVVEHRGLVTTLDLEGDGQVRCHRFYRELS